jgi:hypothetical protein
MFFFAELKNSKGMISRRVHRVKLLILQPVLLFSCNMELEGRSLDFLTISIFHLHLAQINYFCFILFFSHSYSININFDSFVFHEILAQTLVQKRGRNGQIFLCELNNQVFIYKIFWTCRTFFNFVLLCSEIKTKENFRIKIQEIVG